MRKECKLNCIPSPVPSSGVMAGVVAGVLLGVRLFDEKTEEAREETVSMEFMVEERFGGGGIARVATSYVEFDFRGCGFGGGAGGPADSLSLASSPLPTIHQRPDGLLLTLIASFFSVSMSPVTMSVRQHGSSADLTRTLRTTHVAHGNLERLPIPFILPSVHVLHDELDLVKALACLRPEVMLSDLVPVVLRDSAFNTSRLDLVQPVVNGRILLGVAEEEGGIRPGCENRLEVEGLNLKCVKHRHCQEG